MASAIRKLTGVGGDVRKIARLLQKKAPSGHMLAYINQEEADLLKARGGSGKPHADTGIPSFQEYEYDFDPKGGAYLDSVYPAQNTQVSPQGIDLTNTTSQAEQSSPEIHTPALDKLRLSVARTNRGAYVPENIDQMIANLKGEPYPSQFDSSGYYRNVPENLPPVQRNPYDVFVPTDADIALGGERFYTPKDLGFYPGGSESPTTDAIAGAASSILTPRQQGFYPGGSELPTAKADTDLLGDIKGWWSGLSQEAKGRLGLGGFQAILAAYQTQQAAEQGRKAREDIEKVAQPYQQQGRQLIAQAQSGALTPAAQQQLQAVQAQAAQGAERRGGVGAQQAMAQVEAMRQQLLQQQYDYGLKVLGIGDQIAVGAIKAGIQADQYVNSLANSYVNNIARTLYGAPPATEQQRTATGVS